MNRFSFTITNIDKLFGMTMLAGTSTNKYFSGWVENGTNKIKISATHSPSLQDESVSIFSLAEGVVSDADIGTTFMEKISENTVYKNEKSIA